MLLYAMTYAYLATYWVRPSSYTQDKICLIRSNKFVLYLKARAMDKPKLKNNSNNCF
ncbi:Uncharacterised protein [Mycobacteroides abscessus subsp. abscessus]|nr:Uncharacterised protein [Mycobacteroides abscessus subsp. abscessus]